MIFRRGTWDDAIWGSVTRDYPELPLRFAAGEVVLDAGCHTGAVTALCAERGARVIAYEAAFENFALARINTRQYPQAEVRWGALWRSDRAPEPLRFTPAANGDNTGGGGVLFGAPRVVADGQRDLTGLLKAREVPSVPLDDVLREIGHARVFKVDVEGAEFPMLLTSRELQRIDLMVGEIHGFTPEQMANLPPDSRVGSSTYTAELLARFLDDAGFAVLLRPVSDDPLRFLFSARFRRPGGELSADPEPSV